MTSLCLSSVLICVRCNLLEFPKCHRVQLIRNDTVNKKNELVERESISAVVITELIRKGKITIFINSKIGCEQPHNI